jgi:hypothetical protein
VADALRALPLVASLEETAPGELNLRLALAEADQAAAARKAVLQTLLAHDVTPLSIHEGASLEARFLEMTGGTYDGLSST